MSTVEQVNKIIQEKVNTLMRDLPPIIASEAKLFALENFKQKAWRGKTSEPWKARKDKKNQKALLVKDSHLFNSIDGAVTSIQGKGRATITISGTPYGRVHNYGFKGRVKQNVRPFTRRLKNGKKITVSEHSRILNQNIPKRQFIGNFKESPMLQRRINKVIQIEIKTLFK